MLSKILTLIIIVQYLFLAVFTFSENPKSPINRSFSLFSFGVFLWAVTIFLYFFVDVGNWINFVGRLNYSASIIASFGLASFFYFFPKKEFHFYPFNSFG